ncbi:Kinesin light chain 5 [Colletotrichum plurivorum]|uniref:Kinesin light chain 5 n=1 Tax=Colletotrichum plurivorum TaxID=2175906 RepID=A0A8H6JZW2_9PEZI|nr:Kinesin light chain 5 [Colletotrichum plurivorum]
MEGLGVAANVIAVVDLSAKVAALCFQYSKEVAGARGDIQRLHSKVSHVGSAVRAAQGLLKGNRDKLPFASQGLVGSIHECIADLERLEKKLDPKTARTMMRRLGLRALKWPFDSKEVDQVLSSLERHEKTILLGLQIDQTSALVDIQQGVRQLALQATEDATIARRPHRMLPFPPNPDFVHRPPVEKWMRDQYGGPDQRMALVGMGGFGKSQLAIEFAHQVHIDRPGTSVFWVHGKSRATFEESYRTLADVLALPRRREPDVDVLALVRDWLQRDDISPWFMVVDNADDTGVFFLDNTHNDISQGPLASYLPKSTNGKILVTSRSLDAAEKLAGRSRTILQIPAMQEDQALELLTKRLDGETDKAAAIELVSALDYIPLAVNQAAAYINRRSPRVSVMSYLDKFRTSEKQKDSLLRSDKGDLGRHDGVSNSVVVTWQVTFEQIKRERPRAASLLSLMSQFQAHNIPEYMLHSYDSDVAATDEGDADSVAAGTESDEVSDCENFENDMDTLRGYSLVALSSVGFCEMHSLVQFCTRLWISEFGDPARWSRLFVKLAADHFPSGEFETWGTCQSLLPHIEPVLSRKRKGKGDILDWAELLTNVCWYMFMLGEYSRAEILGEEAVNARKNALGLSHPSTLTSMANLASTYGNQGRWEEAEKLEVEVMETSKAKLGADHPDTLTSMANLASTYWNQGRWKEAEELEVRVMERNKRVLGEEHPSTLISIDNLASTYRDQGHWRESEELQLQLIEVWRRALGEEHPSTLTGMANLASTYRNQGRWKEAEELEVRVMETRKRVLGEEHPDTLTSMGNLASTFWNQGRWKEAEELFVRVMETRKRVLGEEHPSTLTSMANLASTYRNQGRWKEAEELFVRVMETMQRVLGEEHPDTLTSMHNLAFTWKDQERWEDAIQLLQNCFRLRGNVLGVDHPETLSSASALSDWELEFRETSYELP